MTNIQDYKVYQRHKDRNRRKTGRRRQAPERSRILAGTASILALLTLVMAFYFISARPEEETDTDTDQLAITENEETEEAFVNILDEKNAELTITWDGKISDAVSEKITSELNEEISALTGSGYSVAFLLYDLKSGGGISYCADNIYYSASAMKAPYVTWLVQTYPDALTDYYSVIENSIVWSSNEDYYTLIDSFGKDDFNSWTASLGSPDIALNVGSFGELTCRSFTRIWKDIYEYFMSGDNVAETLSSFFIGTENSRIYETLGSQYTVYSKAGWYFEGNDSYYTVQNDAGIVMKENHPYIITILSNAYEQFGLLDDLVTAMDQAHTELLEQNM